MMRSIDEYRKYIDEQDRLWLTEMSKEKTPLVGRVTRQELYREFPAFLIYAKEYTPGADSIGKIKQISKHLDILLFLGTWCPDSISEAPKFLKVFDEANNANLKLQILGVDRDKDDGAGLCEKYEIKRVPTILVLKNKRELGRIVEYPKKSHEEDFLEIVGK